MWSAKKVIHQRYSIFQRSSPIFKRTIFWSTSAIPVFPSAMFLLSSDIKSTNDVKIHCLIVSSLLFDDFRRTSQKLTSSLVDDFRLCFLRFPFPLRRLPFLPILLTLACPRKQGRLFWCDYASLQEVLSVRRSAGPSVRPVLFSKVISTHTRRILCRVSGLVLLSWVRLIITEKKFSYTIHYWKNECNSLSDRQKGC